MDNRDTALQLTLHAMDNSLIDTKSCTQDQEEPSGSEARCNAEKIVEFYNYIIELLNNMEEEQQTQEQY
ncbi:MAG: hypothetical protein NC299_16730 [Lachnospiraceae bacterium]|nr:hypothetical protein [Lachnospiraceae bacterium]